MATLRWSLALVALLVLLAQGAIFMWMGIRAPTTSSWGVPAWAAALLVAYGLAHSILWSAFLAWFVRRRLRLE